MNEFPTIWRFSIREPVDRFADWITFESPIRTVVFNPISKIIENIMEVSEQALFDLPWIVVVVIIFLISKGTAGFRIAIFSVVGLLYMGIVGLWESAMSTLTLVGASVFISLIVGIPIGILAARFEKVETVTRPIIDTMQTMPAFVYLIPVMMLFGLGRIAGVVATVVYAIPPAVRLTYLGIRQVSHEAIEASHSFGATSLQTLLKIQLPLALPSIMMGINQTIMMALSMVIIAALVGSRGLGADVWGALRRIEVGKGLEGGLAIVFLAIILDRVSNALSEVDTSRRSTHSKGGEHGLLSFVQQQRTLLISIGVIVSLFIIAQWVGFLNEFPAEWHFSFSNYVDDAVKWMNVNLYFITSWIHDSLFHYLFGPLNKFLFWLPWSVFLFGTTIIAYSIAGLRTAIFSFVGLFLLGVLGEWDYGMDTISQVLVAVVISVVIAIPLGIISSRSDTFETLLRPILDTAQTMPSFVYLIPVVMLFGVGAVSGLIATVVYALPPAIRLTNLGIRQVSREVIEASESLGSTSLQTLVKVELPLAIPSIMLGINQTIMMALAMVIITALIGATGLGLEVALAIGRLQTGRGFEASIAIVLLAMILDRITQASSKRQQEALGLRL
jgi:glycine betaine/proline transport system permease protein